MLIEIHENDIAKIEGTWITTVDGNVYATYEVFITNDDTPHIEGFEVY